MGWKVEFGPSDTRSNKLIGYRYGGLLKEYEGHLDVNVPNSLPTLAIAGLLWAVIGVPWEILDFKLWQLPAGIGAAVAILLVLAGIEHVLPKKWMEEANPELEARQQEIVELPLPYTAVVLVIDSAAEEVLFRGILQYLLTGFVGPAIAILGTNVLFGWLHSRVSNLYNVMTGIAGVLLGVVFAVTGSLWIAIIAHVAMNTNSLILTLKEKAESKS